MMKCALLFVHTGWSKRLKPGSEGKVSIGGTERGRRRGIVEHPAAAHRSSIPSLQVTGPRLEGEPESYVSAGASQIFVLSCHARAADWRFFLSGICPAESAGISS
jgi:hypothetical protein